MSPHSDSPRGGVAIVTELSHRFAAGDGAGALALFHPEIRIEQPESLPHGGTHHGHAAVAAMGESFGEYWDRRIDNPRIFGSDDAVVQLTTQTWTSKGSGRQATADVVELFSFADNMVREIRVFPQDTLALLETLTHRL